MEMSWNRLHRRNLLIAAISDSVVAKIERCSMEGASIGFRKTAYNLMTSFSVIIELNTNNYIFYDKINIILWSK